MHSERGEQWLMEYKNQFHVIPRQTLFYKRPSLIGKFKKKTRSGEQRHLSGPNITKNSQNRHNKSKSIKPYRRRKITNTRTPVSDYYCIYAKICTYVYHSCTLAKPYILTNFRV